MSNELSRVKTYQKKRKKNIVKKEPLEKKPSSDKQSSTQTRHKRGNALSEGRSVRVQSDLRRTRSKVGEDGRSRRARSSDQQLEDNVSETPTRADTYASKRIQISKYFTNTLIFLFVVLTAFLVFWGIKGAPPLEELW